MLFYYILDGQQFLRPHRGQNMSRVFKTSLYPKTYLTENTAAMVVTK